MKHTVKITLIILAMFLAAQIIGLGVVSSYNKYFMHTKEISTGNQFNTSNATMAENTTNATSNNDNVTNTNLKNKAAQISIIKELVPEKVEIKRPTDIISVLTSLIMAIVIATVIFILLMRMKTLVLVKTWFAFVVFIALSISFSLILYPFNVKISVFNLADILAVILAGALTYFKIYKRDILIHNFTELFIYGGIAVIFLPLLNWQIMIGLLIVIMIYDVIAVFKTKHMVRMAKFQMEKLGLIAGFFIPYITKKQLKKLRIGKQELQLIRQKMKQKKLTKRMKQKLKKIKVNVGILGGGDVSFPLMFAATVLIAFGWLSALIVVLFATLSLALLLFTSKKRKFYPAMLFLTPGCLVGLLVSMLVRMFI